MESNQGRPVQTRAYRRWVISSLLPLLATAASAGDSDKANGAAYASTQASVSAIQTFATGHFLGGLRFNLGSNQAPIPTARGAAAQFDIDPDNISYSITPTYTTVDNQITPLLSSGAVGLLVLGAEHFDDIDTVLGLTLTVDMLRVTITERVPPTADVNASVSGTGFTIAPYWAKQTEDGYLLDASLGLGVNNMTIDRSGLTGKPSSQRSFIAFGATKMFAPTKRLMVSSKINYSSSGDTVAAFSLSDGSTSPSSKTTLGQLKVGGSLTYQAKDVSPFAEAYVFTNSFTATGGSGAAPREYGTGVISAIGLKFSGDNKYGIVKYQVEKGKSRFQGYIGLRF